MSSYYSNKTDQMNSFLSDYANTRRSRTDRRDSGRIRLTSDCALPESPLFSDTGYESPYKHRPSKNSIGSSDSETRSRRGSHSRQSSITHSSPALSEDEGSRCSSRCSTPLPAVRTSNHMNNNFRVDSKLYKKFPPSRQNSTSSIVSLPLIRSPERENNHEGTPDVFVFPQVAHSDPKSPSVCIEMNSIYGKIRKKASVQNHDTESHETDGPPPLPSYSTIPKKEEYKYGNDYNTQLHSSSLDRNGIDVGSSHVQVSSKASGTQPNFTNVHDEFLQKPPSSFCTPMSSMRPAPRPYGKYLPTLPVSYNSYDASSSRDHINSVDKNSLTNLSLGCDSRRDLKSVTSSEEDDFSQDALPTTPPPLPPSNTIPRKGEEYSDYGSITSTSGDSFSRNETVPVTNLNGEKSVTSSEDGDENQYSDYGSINKVNQTVPINGGRVGDAKPLASFVDGGNLRPPIASPEEEIDEDRRLYHQMIHEFDKLMPERQQDGSSRSRWEYREEGVLVQEIDEGQPCLSCHDDCPGFTPHMWRKTCNSCKCPREAHDVYHEEWVNVRERLGFKPPADPERRNSREKSLAEGYSWVPPGLPSHKIEEFFSQLPTAKVPKLGTTGDKYRDRQLILQLPKQDLALAYCKHVEAQHHTSYEDFVNARNEIALDIGYVKDNNMYTVKCPECQKTIGPNELAVVAPKFGDRMLWHPACFVCSTCHELLVDLTYCAHDDFLYCERHYAELLKPRCAACDELIFSGEYTKAMSKDWHSGHFSCWQCDESLTGQRYVLRDDHPYCIKCYESVFANPCEECSKIIGIDSKDLSYKDKHWHEACFLCSKCRVSLVDKQFGSKAEKIYCGNCYDAQFASRCDGCGEIFRAGTKKMEYKTRQWHEKCFCCCVCKTAIGTKSFIPREQEIYCATCYEEKFATRCVKCNKIITSGGVTYKNEPWHRECFTCTNCNTSLAGQRFTSRDEKPYCADCFGELFAKRCFACSRPITGIGGTRFISFEDRHWHNDCFICASCKTSLVGRGFITDGDDIICPECAKQKLM